MYRSEKWRVVVIITDKPDPKHNETFLTKKGIKEEVYANRGLSAGLSMKFESVEEMP